MDNDNDLENVAMVPALTGNENKIFIDGGTGIYGQVKGLVSGGMHDRERGLDLQLAVN